LVLVLLIAIVGVIIFMMHLRRQAEKAAQDRLAQSQQTVATQMDQVKSKMKDAIASAEAGNYSDALSKLESVEGSLGLIISYANSEGDQQSASAALAKKGAVMAARKAIEDQKATFDAAVAEQLTSLSNTFGLPAPAPADSGTATSATPAESGTPAAPATSDTPAAQPPAGAPAPATPPASAPAS
jgi:hypothetical protein